MFIHVSSRNRYLLIYIFYKDTKVSISRLYEMNGMNGQTVRDLSSSRGVTSRLSCGLSAPGEPGHGRVICLAIDHPCSRRCFACDLVSPRGSDLTSAVTERPSSRGRETSLKGCTLAGRAQALAFLGARRAACGLTERVIKTARYIRLASCSTGKRKKWKPLSLTRTRVKIADVLARKNIRRLIATVIRTEIMVSLMPS